MAITTFSGLTTAQNISSSYGSTSATTGDTRLSYNRLAFTSTGSGETLRAFSVVSGANAATGGTVNGAHISLSVNSGGSISGAANGLRVTLGGAAGVTMGGTVAALQVDSDLTNTTTIPSNAAFIRVTNSGAGTITNLFNLPDAMVAPIGGTATTATQKIRFVDSAGTAYFLYAIEA